MREYSTNTQSRDVRGFCSAIYFKQFTNRLFRYRRPGRQCCSYWPSPASTYYCDNSHSAHSHTMSSLVVSFVATRHMYRVSIGTLI